MFNRRFPKYKANSLSTLIILILYTEKKGYEAKKGKKFEEK